MKLQIFRTFQSVMEDKVMTFEEKMEYLEHVNKEMEKENKKLYEDWEKEVRYKKMWWILSN